MAERLEPFRQALIDLRRRLREGDLPPGTRITAKEVADSLRLSPTPVREALSRLAGEGLLQERRGDGFFVPELSAADIAVLYRLGEQLLLMSQGVSWSPQRDARAPQAAADEDPVGGVEQLFLAWVGESGSRVMIDAYRTAAVRLAPVRRREVAFIDDLAQEAQALLRLVDPAQRPARAAAIQVFHQRRIALAERLADVVRSVTPEEG